MKRSASSIWQGSGKEGKGSISTQSGVLDNTQFSFSTRFEDGIGTNPEELIAAAHAGCFNMKLSFVLGNSGFVPEMLETTCVVTLGEKAITSSELTLTAKIDGIDKETFEAAIQDAKENCPISVLYNTEITLNYTLF